MKTLKQGKTMAAWWVGQQLTCTTCGHRVELEAGDERTPTLAITDRRVGLLCPLCNREVMSALNTSDWLRAPAPKAEKGKHA